MGIFRKPAIETPWDPITFKTKDVNPSVERAEVETAQEAAAVAGADPQADQAETGELEGSAAAN